MEIKIDRLIRSKRKSISLLIPADGTLVVKAPSHASLDYIKDFVQKKQNWIRKKQQLAQNRPTYKPKQFIEGECFYFLGRAYALEIVPNRHEGIELKDTLFLSQKSLNRPREKMTAWYKKQAMKIIRERVQYYARQTGLVPNSIRITGAQKRWGSCSPSGRVNFSWRLVMAPPEIIDYVVVHELMHLRIKNHSLSFKNGVTAVLPDSKERERWLKVNGYLLEL